MDKPETQLTIQELEERLLDDNTFQHILKFAPQSQRELMTFELSKYFTNYITQALTTVRNEMEGLKKDDDPLTDNDDDVFYENLGFNQAISECQKLLEQIGESK